ncbi:MAG: hypothetical protein HZA20_06625 [Nitrospirae bacterium]|nr:hypothetical protein [Nitrospirota bacterium]
MTLPLSLRGFTLALALSFAVLPVSAHGEQPAPAQAPGVQVIPVIPGAPPPIDDAPPLLAPQDAVSAVKVINYQAGILTVELKKIPAVEVFTDIGTAAGFTTIIDPTLETRPVSVKFANQPLERALTRIIGLMNAGNYRFDYALDGRIERVSITASQVDLTKMPRGGGPPQPPPRRKPPPRPQ